MESVRSKFVTQKAHSTFYLNPSILKYMSTTSKEDKKRVLDALQSVGLPHGKVRSLCCLKQ